MSRMWRGARALVLAATGAFALAAPGAALAAEDVVPEPVEGPVPQEILDRFADCPGYEAFDAGIEPVLCVNLNATGDLELGNVESSIEDPLTVSVGLGLGQGFTPVIVPAEGGSPRPVKVPGGILGVPELDPIIDLTEPLGLLTLTATPNLGEADTSQTGAFELLFFLAGQFGTIEGAGGEIVLGTPLALKLNNTLFGNKCEIGTAEEPIDINLTTGTSNPGPDSGAEPISGSFGEGYGYRFVDVNGYEFYETTGTTMVDNSFATPGPTKCDLLLGDLLDQPSGLFDPLIGFQTGLPAGPGASSARLEIGTQMATYQLIHGER